MSDLFSRVAAQFDSYSRTARLKPGLLVLLGPVAVAVGAGAPQWPVVSALAGVAVAMGLPFAFADWVRRRGQALQRRLWAEWGGNPVVVALRGKGVVARQRRTALADQTGLPVGDPSHAEYEEAATNAVRRLISATRDTSKYPLIFVENKAYGFARNLYAVRDVGRRLSAAALVAGVVLVVASTKLNWLSSVSTSLGALLAALAAGLWRWYPSETRVLAAAEDYRDRLLEALDSGVDL